MQCLEEVENGLPIQNHIFLSCFNAGVCSLVLGHDVRYRSCAYIRSLGILALHTHEQLFQGIFQLPLNFDKDFYQGKAQGPSKLPLHQ
jgi:hypothetical protein